MQNLIDFLNENKYGQIATIKDNKPVMRPFQFVFEKDGRFYFSTSNTKDVYMQLKDCGVAGYAVLAQDLTWARLSGEVGFVDDLDIKEEALNNNAKAKAYLKTADNPLYVLFYIHNGVASLHDRTGALIEEIAI